MDDLKKLPGKIKDKAVDKLKDTMDKVNPMSPINKMKTLADKEKIKKLQKDKEKLTTQAKGIVNKIKTLRAKTKK
jgi:acyl-CoA reductase-like NAD-dependent aldehyde dehydrogenase